MVRTKNALRQQKAREKARADGKCVDCKSRPQERGVKCNGCADRQIARIKARRQKRTPRDRYRALIQSIPGGALPRRMEPLEREPFADILRFLAAQGSDAGASPETVADINREQIDIAPRHLADCRSAERLGVQQIQSAFVGHGLSVVNVYKLGDCFRELGGACNGILLVACIPSLIGHALSALRHARLFLQWLIEDSLMLGSPRHSDQEFPRHLDWWLSFTAEARPGLATLTSFIDLVMRISDVDLRRTFTGFQREDEVLSTRPQCLSRTKDILLRDGRCFFPVKNQLLVNALSVGWSRHCITEKLVSGQLDWKHAEDSANWDHDPLDAALRLFVDVYRGHRPATTELVIPYDRLRERILVATGASISSV
jgi:hypothetical protein